MALYSGSVCLGVKALPGRGQFKRDLKTRAVDDPLENLPPHLAQRFRKAKKKSQTQGQSRELHGGSNVELESPRNGRGRPSSTQTHQNQRGRNIADIWQVRPVDSSATGDVRSCKGADNSLLQQLKERTRQMLGSKRSNSSSSPASTSPKSFMEAIRDAGPAMSNPVADPEGSYSNVRSEDERIRATRQQRMAEQGLDGSANTGWRTGKQDDGELNEAENFSQLLRTNAETDTEQSLSPEQFTIRKEAQERDRGAEVISSDKSYKPAVGTWGIYERPKDISKTFGGGRKLTPADSATSAEEQAEFDATLKEQLSRFRSNAGLDVDPAVEAECIKLTDEGKVLLKTGNLTGALVIFDEASNLLSCKTDAGGAAMLQKAITLDSLGKSDEALKLYRQLCGHRCLEVAKTAKTMSFGFKAAGEFLKADKFSYAAKSEELDPYFSALRGKWGWETAYVPTEEEKQAQKKSNAALIVVAALLVFAPLGFFWIVLYQC